MSSRRGRKGSVEDLFPTDPDWAWQTWRDRYTLKDLDGGPGMIREAARSLMLPEEEADRARKNGQCEGPFQSVLVPHHVVTGGGNLVRETRAIVEAVSSGSHISDIGHGITPYANLTTYT